MNQLLEQTKSSILAKAEANIRPVIEKVVAAGQKAIYSPEMREMTLKQLGDGQDPELIGAGVAKLAGILYNQSKNTIPMQALIPSAMILLCEGLQFLEDGGAREIDADFLANCTQAMTSNLLQLLGVSPEKLDGMINQPGSSTAPAKPTGIVAGAQGAM